MELILRQQEPLEHIAAPVRVQRAVASLLHSLSACRANSFHDQDVLLSPRLVAWAVPYLSPGAQGPRRRD